MIRCAWAVQLVVRSLRVGKALPLQRCLSTPICDSVRSRSHLQESLNTGRWFSAILLYIWVGLARWSAQRAIVSQEFALRLASVVWRLSTANRVVEFFECARTRLRTRALRIKCDAAPEGAYGDEPAWRGSVALRTLSGSLRHTTPRPCPPRFALEVGRRASRRRKGRTRWD